MAQCHQPKHTGLNRHQTGRPYYRTRSNVPSNVTAAGISPDNPAVQPQLCGKSVGHASHRSPLAKSWPISVPPRHRTGRYPCPPATELTDIRATRHRTDRYPCRPATELADIRAARHRTGRYPCRPATELADIRAAPPQNWPISVPPHHRTDRYPCRPATELVIWALGHTSSIRLYGGTGRYPCHPPQNWPISVPHNWAISVVRFLYHPRHRTRQHSSHRTAAP